MKHNIKNAYKLYLNTLNVCVERCPKKDFWEYRIKIDYNFGSSSTILSSLQCSDNKHEYYYLVNYKNE